jgi:hypothetical protein
VKRMYISLLVNAILFVVMAVGILAANNTTPYTGLSYSEALKKAGISYSEVADLPLKRIGMMYHRQSIIEHTFVLYDLEDKTKYGLCAVSLDGQQVGCSYLVSQ